MTSTYLIADVEVHDPIAYENYKALSSIAMQAHGAEVCIRGGPIALVEGDWQPRRVVMLKFPSSEAARRFWDSPEYQKARAAREGIATMRAIMVDGV